MNQQEIVHVLENYEQELSDILGRFSSDGSGLHIASGDCARFTQLVHEATDMFRDHIDGGDHSADQLVSYANYSLANWLRSPSYVGVEKVQSLVVSVLTRVKRNPSSIRHAIRPASSNANTQFIEKIAERLPTVIRELRDRREDRATLDVNDEYDLQDLVRGLLRIEFDDVRCEEWTPSYAGGSSRMDFLVPQVEAVAEMKMTRRGLTARKLGEELIIDIARYERHPHCRTLVCIVYDPEGRITNPRGIENDLGSHSEKNMREGHYRAPMTAVTVGK